MPEERTFFYKMWHQLIQALPKSSRLDLYEAILDYAFFEKETIFEKNKTKTVYEIAKKTIEISQKKREVQLNLRNFAQAKPKHCSTNCSSNAEATLRKETKEEKVPSPYTPIFKEQEKREGFNSADADTDAYALEADDPSDLEEFAFLMQDHLRYDDDFRAAWREWLDYRKKTRKKVSRFAAVKQLNLLGEYDPGDAIRIIETSIQNDWQGLFPTRLKNIKPAKDYTGL